MYGLTRATLTLIGVGVAGFLIWLATQMGTGTSGYWARVGLLAAAGLTIALSQLLGGWTKWGVPHVSGSVFMLAFLPTLVVAGWAILLGQPFPNWFQRHTSAWADDIHVSGLLRDVAELVPVLAFGTGLVFGLTFDTSGPRPRRVETRPLPEPVSSRPVEQTQVVDEERVTQPTEARVTRTSNDTGETRPLEPVEGSLGEARIVRADHDTEPIPTRRLRGDEEAERDETQVLAAESDVPDGRAESHSGEPPGSVSDQRDR